jgi:hypothetical protein
MGERRSVRDVRFRALDAGRAFKEKFHGHAENARDLLQPAGADPVDALLVFLDLLEGEAEVLGPRWSATCRASGGASVCARRHACRSGWAF